MGGFLANKSLLSPTVTQYAGGTASFTLPQSGSTNSTQVLVGGVEQVPGVDFTVSGTGLTLTTSAPAGANMVCARQYFTDGIVNTPADNSVATAKIQDNAINLSKMAGGTDGQIITYDANGDPVAVGPGSDGEVLTSTGAGSPPAFEAVSAGGFTQGTAQATESGGGHKTFTGIPAGTDMIIINLFNVGLSNPDEFEIQIGDSGGFETTAYQSCSFQASSTSTRISIGATHAYVIKLAGAGYDMSGQMILTLQNSSTNAWLSNHMINIDPTITAWGAGYKQLSGELTQVRVGPYAAGNYDISGSSVNIMYM